MRRSAALLATPGAALAVAPTRRVAVRAAMSAALSAALGGCGFALSRAPELPFASIALDGFAPRSALAEELTQQLGLSARVLRLDQKPEVILRALVERRDKRAIATTAAGQVRELQLQLHFEFKLSTPAGKELLARTALGLARDISYSETLALAKEQEQGQLFAAMQSEIVMQVLRRLARAAKA